MNKIQTWFGPKFERLHPQLQALHLHGGTLSGPVTIKFGTGLAGRIGQSLARKLGIPTEGSEHQMQVDIHHDADGLHWDRNFDQSSTMRSLFKPIGVWPQGHWIEETGPVRMALTVDVVDGGWYWRCQKIWVRGLRVPLWAIPESSAYKKFEDGHYKFFVGFSLPLIGQVLSYSGNLALETNAVA